MTTLIFVTETDASPLIHLNADPAAVVHHLATSLPAVWFNDPPGTYAAAFLCGLGEELTGAWSPRIESTPIFCYGAFGGYQIDIAWNPLTWKQWDEDGDGVALPSHAHPAAEQAGTDGPLFLEVSQSRYDEMLGAVPPAVHLSRGFLMGEAWTGKACAARDCQQGCRNPRDCDAYHAFLTRDGLFYEAEAPMTIGEFRELDTNAVNLVKGPPAYDTATRAATRGVGFVCALLLAGSLMIGAAQAQMYPPYGSPGTPTMSGPFGDSGFGNSTTIYTPPPIGSVPRVPSVYSPVPEPSQGPSNYPCTLPVGCR